MNRILFEKDEIVDGVVTFGGTRAEHVLSVLHGEVGQILKTGEVNGPIGTGEIVGIQLGIRNGELGIRNEGRFNSLKEKKSSAIRNSSFLIPNSSPSITVRVSHGEKSLAPWVDVILAPPRPRVMKRLLPQMAAMGVGRIILVGAEKVEKDFWGATLLKEENYRPLLIDGLMQCGTSILPTIETWKSFNRFLCEGLPTLTHERRIVAHPYEKGIRNEELGIRSEGRIDSFEKNVNSAIPNSSFLIHNSLLLAIGPEGGWTDAEVEKLEQAGFVRYSLGSRILRTDTATIALLARLQS